MQPNHSTTPISDISSRVMYRIRETRIARLKRRSIFYGSLAVASLAAAIPAAILVNDASGDTGTWQYLSLITTDGSYIMNNWQEYCLTIVESLPLGTIIICTAVIFSASAALGRGLYCLSSLRSKVKARPVQTLAS